MKMIYTILIPHGASKKTQDLLSTLGAKMASSPSHWTIPDESAQSAVNELQQQGIEYRLLYEYSPGTDDPVEEAAAYLCLPPESERGNWTGPLLVEPPEGTTPLGNQEIIDMITPLTSATTWAPSDISGLKRLDHASPLPDPVKIAHCFGKTQGRNGLWLIEHDGREYLTSRNIEILRHCGVAWSSEYEYEKEIFPVVPVLIFSGKIIELLLKNRVPFSAPPIYLLKKSHNDNAGEK